MAAIPAHRDTARRWGRVLGGGGGGGEEGEVCTGQSENACGMIVSILARRKDEREADY